MRPLDLAPRWTRLRAVLVVALCGFAVLGWQGVTTLGHEGADDAGEHLLYAEFIAAHWRLPTKSENYEYSSPPLFQATAVAAEKLVHVLPVVSAELSSNAATRGLWLALIAFGAAAMTAARRRIRIGGATAIGLGALWGLDEAVALSKSEAWSAGQLIALVSGAGLILVAGLIAREVWPGNTRRAIAVGGFVAAYPVVYRTSILFHPEMPFALLCAVAMLLFLRAAQLGWPARLGWQVGAVCSVCAVTRQPAALLMACLGATALAVGGRTTRAFLLRAAIPIALIAGPWWITATYRWHNPLQSNLELTPDHMLSSQPASFYFQMPLRSLVVHPYRPDFTNDLLPKLHAELWSDWFGAIHGGWGDPPADFRVIASTQSVLGFFGDALALGGLAALAIPAAVRVVRRRRRGVTTPNTMTDVGLGLLALVAVAAFAAFVLTLIRFPQRDGDPIKSTYLLFTAPCWAVFSVAAWSAARRRWKKVGAVLAMVGVLYAGSYTADLADALAHPGVVSNLDPLPDFVDLSTNFQQTNQTPDIGGEVDFLVGVDNSGGKEATGVTLTVKLSPAMTMIGLPYYDVGTCNKALPIRCNFGDIGPGLGDFIRIAVNVNAGGPQTLTASTAGNEHDADESNNTSTDTVNLGPA